MRNYPDYYEILQVHPSAEKEVIDAAYRKLASKYHPDINKSREAEERMKQINEAYDVLSDPVKKAKYDNFMKSQQSGNVRGNDRDSEKERVWSRIIVPIASVLLILGLLRINPRIALFAGLVLLLIYFVRSFRGK
jgi:curved DNA-binding protein CbpA